MLTKRVRQVTVNSVERWYSSWISSTVELGAHHPISTDTEQNLQMLANTVNGHKEVPHKA